MHLCAQANEAIFADTYVRKSVGLFSKSWAENLGLLTFALASSQNSIQEPRLSYFYSEIKKHYFCLYKIFPKRCVFIAISDRYSKKYCNLNWLQVVLDGNLRYQKAYSLIN